MRNPFTSHPSEVNETYLQHMRYALLFSAKLMIAGVCAFIHAFLPFLFKKTASTIVHFYHDYLIKRFENSRIREGNINQELVKHIKIGNE